MEVIEIIWSIGSSLIAAAIWAVVVFALHKIVKNRSRKERRGANTFPIWFMLFVSSIAIFLVSMSLVWFGTFVGHLIGLVFEVAYEADKDFLFNGFIFLPLTLGFLMGTGQLIFDWFTGK